MDELDPIGELDQTQQGGGAGAADAGEHPISLSQLIATLMDPSSVTCHTIPCMLVKHSERARSTADRFHWRLSMTCGSWAHLIGQGEIMLQCIREHR